MPSSLQWETVEALVGAGAMFMSIIICSGIFRCRMLPKRHHDTVFQEVQGLYTSSIVYQSWPTPSTNIFQHHETPLEEKHDAIYENFGNGLEINQHTAPGPINEAGVCNDSELQDTSMYLNEANNIYCNYGVTCEDNHRFDEDYIFPDEHCPAEEPSEFHCE